MIRKKWLIVGVVFLSGCFRNPIPPSWDTELNLPLAKKTILMRDICDDSTEDTIALLDENYEIDTIWAKEFLVLDSICDDTLISFDNILIKTSYKGTTYFTLGELYPELIPYQDSCIDTTVTGVPFDATHSIILDENFKNITVDSGYIVLSMTNNLPLDVESLQVLLLPDTLEFNFHGLAVGETREETQSLSGKSIENPMSCEVHGKTAPGKSFVVDTLDAIQTDVEVRIITLSSLIGAFPSCTVEIKAPVPLKPYQLYSAEIDSGTFTFSFLSEFKNEFEFLLKGDECDFFPFSCPIQKGANDSTVSFENVSMNPVNPDTLKLNGYILPAIAPVIDTLDELDTFALSIELSDLYFGHLHGYIDTVICEKIASQGKRIDYGDFDPTDIELDDAWFYARLWSNLNASPEIRLKLLGIRGTETESLHIQTTVNFGENYIKVSGDSVVDFVNLFPESIDVSGEVSLTGEVDVRGDDFIYGVFGIEVPVSFALTDTLTFEPESIRIEVPKEIREAEIIDTKLLIHYDNTLPLEGEFILFLSTDSSSYGDTLVRVDINESSYRSKEILKLENFLEEEIIWGRLLVKFYPDTVTALITDKFDVKSLLKVKVRVKE